MRRQRILGRAALLGCGAWLMGVAAAAQPTPDLILYNGHIVTVDARFSTAEAVAIADGTFVKVGRNAEIRALKGATTREIDLRGRTVVPGFVDAHAHLLTRVNTAKPSLEGLTSVQAVADAIALAARTTPAGQWIVTSPIGEGPDYFNLPDGLAERRWPTRLDLDRAAPDHPVYIPTPGTWPHPAVFNSAALKILGISADTPAEQGGVFIQKDAQTGEPTGLVDGLHFYNRSSPLLQKLQPLLPRASVEATMAAMREAMKVAHAVGLTTVYEAHGTQPSQLAALRRLWSNHDLTLRVGFAYDVDISRPLPDLERWMRDDLAHLRGSGFGDDRLKVIGITVAVDGAAQFGATLMNKPYRDPYGRPTTGTQGVAADTLSRIAVLAAKHDLRLNVTFAGDKAADLTLAAFDAANRESSIRGKRWLLQHMQHPTPEQMAHVKALDAVVSTYTSVDFSKGAAVYVDRFDGDAWKTVVPMRQWLDAGVLVAQSTDGAHFQPLFTLWESLARVDGRTGKSLLTREKQITREEALRIYTINGAKVLFWEDRIGSIEAGKLADLVVLERDILSCPLDQIRDTKVLMTIGGGRIVYEVK